MTVELLKNLEHMPKNYDVQSQGKKICDNHSHGQISISHQDGVNYRAEVGIENIQPDTIPVTDFFDMLATNGGKPIYKI